MTLPPKIEPQRVQDQRWKSPGHRRWVAGFQCCVPLCQQMPIECAHVRTGTDGGTGLKPSDQWTISLCKPHHREQHQIGEPEFERRHGIDMKALASEFFAKSPYRKRRAA